MRHRRRSRRLGRSSSHRLAMFRNMASSLFLTERDAEDEDNAPKVKGRIITTLEKAKEVRSLVEKCITLACRALDHQEKAEEFASDAERGSEEWKQWRHSPRWREWADAIAPVVTARRRAMQMLGDKQAVRILFDSVAPRFTERKGGYTRVLRLAKPRLGDAGTRAMLEFVGTHDRVIQRSEKPAFADERAEKEPAGAAATPADTASEPAAAQDEQT